MPIEFFISLIDSLNLNYMKKVCFMALHKESVFYGSTCITEIIQYKVSDRANFSFKSFFSTSFNRTIGAHPYLFYFLLEICFSNGLESFYD